MTVAEKIERYIPKMPPAYWATIEEFVRSCVTDAEPRTPYSARALLGALTPLVRWSWDRGYELERRVILDRFTIEEFISTGSPASWASGSRANCRSQLFRLSECLLGAGARTPRLIPLSSSNPSEPYTTSELVAFRSWAGGQNTVSKRRSATALLSLCAGAGLSTEDLVGLQVRHIAMVDGYVVVNVQGRRARQTCVLAEWESGLADIVSSMSPDDYVFCPQRIIDGKNTVSNFVTKTSGVHKPQSQRLRATWIVHHLSAATPVNVLMTAAGVLSLDALARYVQFVPDAEPAEVPARLRGGITSGERD